MTRSLESVEEIAGAGQGRLPLCKFVIMADKSEAKEKNLKKQKLECESD